MTATKAPKRFSRNPKYRAAVAIVDGIRFESKKELSWYRHFKSLADAGIISDLEVHPSFLLNGAGGKPLVPPKGRRGYNVNKQYRCDLDFAYTEGGKRHYIDIKGQDLPMSRLKRAMVQQQYGIEVEVITSLAPKERSANA